LGHDGGSFYQRRGGSRTAPTRSEYAQLYQKDPHRPRLRCGHQKPAGRFAPPFQASPQPGAAFKREDLQPVFSFKLRGAYNKIVKLPRETLARGIICASVGNHAQGVALAAQRLGVRAVIVMPVTTPAIKVESVPGGKERNHRPLAAARL